ncbi:hypothetical protein HYZ76_01100, partial [Candidatus Falkowbacteria bacterium]|nr:hypothetical protein [Candidatus Falkowbacteria bacterium]
MFNLKFLVDLIFPVECLGCDKPGEWLCASCFKEIKINDSEENPKLRQNDFLTGVLVCSDYNQEVLAKALRYYKYNFVVDLSEPLSKLLINFLRFKTGEGKTIDFDLVAPVPLSRKRKMWRGFNQS